MKCGGDKDDNEYNINKTKLYEHVNKRQWLLIFIK